MVLEITNETPLPLKGAVKLAFPAGGLSVSSLRREQDRGNLRTEIVARKEFTTLGDIARMRELCRSKHLSKE